MNDKLSKRILWLSAISSILGILSLILPRLSQGETGLAAAATAAIVFLGLFIIALLMGLVLLIVTAINFKKLSNGIRIAGIAPMIIVVVAFLFVLTRL